jgi:hypothetical protein
MIKEIHLFVGLFTKDILSHLPALKCFFSENNWLLMKTQEVILKNICFRTQSENYFPEEEEPNN